MLKSKVIILPQSAHIHSFNRLIFPCYITQGRDLFRNRFVALLQQLPACPLQVQ